MVRRACLFAVWLAGPGSAAAQTELACRTAADVVAESPHAGGTLTLHQRFTEPEAVHRMVAGRFGADIAAAADMVQVFYLGQGRHLIMAAVQGCHLAHEFSEDAA